jgi:glycine cleavage system aminomethyltransferase T
MDTYGNVRRHLVGLVMNGSIIPPRGAKIFSGDREVGWVSSATDSPQLKTPIALAFPLRDFSAPGTNLTIEVNGARHDGTVRALPFYRRT